MPELTKLQKKVLLNLATHPIVLIPFLFGATTLMVMWTFDISSMIAKAISMLSILGSIGIFLTNFFLGGETATKAAITSLKKEAEQETENRLNKLDDKLTQDNDPRTERMLRDLRSLVSDFRGGNRLSEIESNLALEFATDIEQLFNNSIRMLEQSLDLWNTAQTVNTITGRVFLEKREIIIKEVQTSIEQIGRTLADIRLMSVDNCSQQARIRQELANNVEIQRRVRNQLSDMLDDSPSMTITLNQEQEKSCLEQSGDCFAE